MDTFFVYLKRTLFAFTLSIFAVSMVYVPQPWNEVPVVEAGGGGFATEVTQILNNIELAAIYVADNITAVQSTFSALADAWQWTKENALDGIAWTLAKAVVSGITSSIVNWINSGFQGSPAFITDLPGFLLGVADGVAGEFIESLGGIGSFICSPFQLDVQISLAVLYDQGRTGSQSAPTCTLTGIIDNIEGFIGGLTDVSQGGWNDWFDITARPDMYTPYGQVLSAQAGLRASLVNARGEEIKLLDFGEGFLSGEICDLVETEGTPREDCFISKPGQIIEEALTFTTSTGQRSLIAADEFNEIISALLGQLVQQVVTGAAGLLGLSGGTGYTYSGYEGSFVDQMANDALGNLDASSIIADMQEAEQNEVAAWNYITGAQPPVANSPINRLQVMINDTSSTRAADVRKRQRAQALLDQMITIRNRNATIAPNQILTDAGNILTIQRITPVLEAANNPGGTIDSLRTLAINAGVLTAAEISADVTLPSLKNQIITKVVQEFTRRTFATNDTLGQLQAEFTSIAPPDAGGRGATVPAVVNPTPTTPTNPDPVLPPPPPPPTSPSNPTTPTNPDPGLPPPPPPPPAF